MKLIEKLALDFVKREHKTGRDITWREGAAYQEGFRKAREMAGKHVLLPPYGTLTMFSDPNKPATVHWDLEALNMIALDILKLGEEEVE